MTQNETIAEYSVKLINMITEIRELRGSVTDTEVVEKLFASVTDTFTDIVGTIEQFGDVSKMTVPEAIERLRTHEENRKGKKQMKEDGEKLLYTRNEPKSKEGRRAQATTGKEEVADLKKAVADRKATVAPMRNSSTTEDPETMKSRR